VRVICELSYALKVALRSQECERGTHECVRHDNGVNIRSQMDQNRLRR
jgi:hypothetical protein